MAHHNLNSTKSKYADYSSSNRIFLNNMARHRKESQHLDFSTLRDKIATVSVKLKGLSPEDRQQWVEIHQAKIRQLYSMFPDKPNMTNSPQQTKLEEYGNALREALHTLVGVCDKMNLQYKTQVTAEIIQKFYYYEYKEDVLQSMEEAGYATGQFKVLRYQETSFFNSICCCLDANTRIE